MFYIDIDGKVHDKRSIDIMISRGVRAAENYRVATPEETEEILNPPKSQGQIISESKANRDAAISDFSSSFVGTVEFDGAAFQASERSYTDMSNAVRKAELNGYDDSDSRLWRLEDNSWRETTLGEIKQIMPMVRDAVDAATLQRWEDVWTAFNIWDDGDKQEPFTYE